MKTRLKNCYSRPSSQAGAAAVELAFVIVLMLLIVGGIIEFGRAFWYADALTKSTRDGARLMSNWPAASMSAGPGAARVLVRQMSNAANVAPVLTDTNVEVECLNAAFGVVACSDGSAPANVRVSITEFTIGLGSWMPFVGPGAAGLNSNIVSLSPHTTMRYMNQGTP